MYRINIHRNQFGSDRLYIIDNDNRPVCNSTKQNHIMPAQYAQ